MPDDVLITGGGISACCCAALLNRDGGFRLFSDLAARGSSPMLMLSTQTQHLLRDVFGCEDLFVGAVQISRRVVLWGENGKPLVLPHSGLVMSEAVLSQRLRSHLNVEDMSLATAPAWTVLSSITPLSLSSQHQFGSRIASVNSVALSDDACAESCWVESVKDGWLFLIPCGAGTGSLISVGVSPNHLLAQSRLVCDQIHSLGHSIGSFPAHPRIVIPLYGERWLACGSAALGFDPIAGEGTGNALREGILASAVVKAMGKAGSPEELLCHYSNRMLSGFLRHLQECCRFYESVASGWWESELDSMRQGIRWAQQTLASYPAGRFRLLGFELQRNNV